MSGAKTSPVGTRNPAQYRAGSERVPAVGGASYDPSDRQHDGRRIDALAELVRAIAAAPKIDGEVRWGWLCVHQSVDGGYAVELGMPIRTGLGTYFSAHPLMDETWDGIVPRNYATPEEAVRALLDNIICRLPELKTANIGGDSRF